MASYQIPQFLDSGDKILGPLNIRQFGYALGGFFISVLIFTTVQNINPSLGWYSIIPALPFIGTFAYLALGKFNGRDSEIYVLKFIIYFTKPRQMKYIRAPEVSDLNEQLSLLTYDKIMKEWASRVAKIKQLEQGQLIGFTQLTAEERAKRIRQLGTQLDMGFYNTLSTVHQREITLEQKQALLQVTSSQKGGLFKSSIPQSSIKQQTQYNSTVQGNLNNVNESLKNPVNSNQSINIPKPQDPLSVNFFDFDDDEKQKS